MEEEQGETWSGWRMVNIPGGVCVEVTCSSSIGQEEFMLIACALHNDGAQGQRDVAVDTPYRLRICKLPSDISPWCAPASTMYSM